MKKTVLVAGCSTFFPIYICSERVACGMLRRAEMKKKKGTFRFFAARPPWGLK